MKKNAKILFAVALTFTLVGCQDASASISNGSKAIITVGDEKITNEDIYSMTKKTYGSALALNLVMNKICDQENIKITDKMKEEANKQLAEAKTGMGDSFAEQLKAYGYDNEEDYKTGDIYPALRQKELVKKYVTSKKKTLFKSYTPVKAQIFETDDAEKANNALEAIKGGKTLAEASTSFGTTTTYKGEEALYTSKSGLPEVVFDKIKAAKEKGLIESVIEDTANNKHYIVQLTNIDPTTFEDAAIDEIVSKGATDLQTTANAYFLKKYEFKIYDKDVYDGIKSTNKSYIVS